MMNRNAKTGYTLIEVLLTVALVGVVALLMYSFFGQGFALYGVETASAEEQMNLRQAMSDITNVVRITDPDDISIADGVLTVGSRQYKLSDGSIQKNGAAIANGIEVFDVSRTSDGMLVIRIVNQNGTELKTSLSLGSSQTGGTA
jgi:prepilin-type N-terminal cleavage/methylation domain-containing protein